MWAVGGRAWILRLDNSHLLELDSHRARGHGELVREPAHHVLDAHAIAGKTEPAPPHLGKRHQQLRRERAGLPLVEVAARLEEADRLPSIIKRSRPQHPPSSYVTQPSGNDADKERKLGRLIPARARSLSPASDRSRSTSAHRERARTVPRLKGLLHLPIWLIVRYLDGPRPEQIDKGRPGHTSALSFSDRDLNLSLRVVWVSIGFHFKSAMAKQTLVPHEP